MDEISWAGAFMVVGMMACVTWGLSCMVRGPRVIHIHHDSDEEEDE